MVEIVLIQGCRFTCTCIIIMTLYVLYYYVCIQLVLYATDLQSLTNSKCIHNYSV